VKGYKLKIGIGSYAYRWAIRMGKMDAFSLLDRSSEAGAQVVQVCDNLPLDRLPDARLDALARHAADLGLALEVGIKGSRPEHLRRNLEVTRQLDAHLLRVVLTTAGWEPPFDEFVAIFKALLPDLRDAGVTVAVENHFYLPPVELARLIEAIDDPLVGVCLDPLNSITRLVGVAETVATLAPYTVSVHVKDAVITRPGAGFYIAGCPLGEGLVDLAGMLDAVWVTGRSPNVLVECWMDRLDDEAATLAQEEAWIRQGMAYVRRLVGFTIDPSPIKNRRM
jgi:sugar phosphate isomerase/epimerase